MPLNRTQPQELSFDLVVVGGGLAGFCAAVAAARRGARTALVHDRPVLGGNASSEIGILPLGAAGYSAWARETGILEEVLLAERAQSHMALSNGMSRSNFDLLLYEAAKREPHLSLFLNTTVRAVDTEKVDTGVFRIAALHGSQLASEKELVFRGVQFADCTGDGTVGALAGAEFRYGREARSEFNEPLAPAKGDEQTMGSSMFIRARDVGRPAPFVAPDWISVYKTPEEIGRHSIPPFHDAGGYWWIEVGTPYHQITDNQAIKEELLRHVLGVWNYSKNYGPEREKLRNYTLEWMSTMPGKRESRRLVGDVLMTEHDCHHDVQWPDRVAYAGWNFDIHVMGGILNKKECHSEPTQIDMPYMNWVRIPLYSIPLRSLYSRNVVNLWMAGRDMSATHVAMGSTRVMPSCALQGQAVGTAAAVAIANKLSPRQAAAPTGPHIRTIQQHLLKDDVHVLGMRNDDPADLARTARASATSAARLDLSRVAPNAYKDIGRDMQALVLPLTSDRLDEVEVFLKNISAAPVMVSAELHELEHIWQRKGGNVLAKFTFIAPPNSEGWVKARPNVKVTPQRAHRLALGCAPQVSWARCQGYPTGVLRQYLFTSPGGCNPVHAHMQTFKDIVLPACSLWNQHTGDPLLAVRLTPESAPYAAANVNNGYAWPFATPNLWISDPTQALPQSVTLDFGGAKRFNTIYVSFDTDLKLPYHEMGIAHRAHTCARNWRLHACCDGQWKQVYEEIGNYQRRRKAVFAPVLATHLKLEVLATNADPAGDPGDEGRSARVYEVRVYDE